MKEYIIPIPKPINELQFVIYDKIPERYTELIRCKDCKYNNGGRCGWHGGAGYKCIVDDYDFCSCGERRTDE